MSNPNPTSPVGVPHGPGVSANPGGRPRKPFTKKLLQMLAKEDGLFAKLVRAQIEKAAQGDTDAFRVSNGLTNFWRAGQHQQLSPVPYWDSDLKSTQNPPPFEFLWGRHRCGRSGAPRFAVAEVQAVAPCRTRWSVDAPQR
jgi:hypothetical protein